MKQTSFPLTETAEQALRPLLDSSEYFLHPLYLDPVFQEVLELISTAPAEALERVVQAEPGKWNFDQYRSLNAAGPRCLVGHLGDLTLKRVDDQWLLSGLPLYEPFQQIPGKLSSLCFRLIEGHDEQLVIAALRQAAQTLLDLRKEPNDG
jgi:hypothetical protein